MLFKSEKKSEFRAYEELHIGSTCLNRWLLDFTAINHIALC